MLIDGKHYRTIWEATNQAYVEIIDQTSLPHTFKTSRILTLDEMVSAIKQMQVRGAPLIGVAAAYGIALALREDASDSGIQSAVDKLAMSRPTAVNLSWALRRMQSLLMALDVSDRAEAAWQMAGEIAQEDIEQNRRIGEHGLAIFQQLYRQNEIHVLTHCNAGWLATVDYGTALAPVYMAYDAGIPIHVWVDETRPRNQGAFLTAWELRQHGIPHTVITDNAGGLMMQRGMVDIVLVGADRVSAKGDVCNKIGTYLKALAAHDNDVPFYAAVPSPTIDFSIQNGLEEIPIEERGGEEMTMMTGLSEDNIIHQFRVLPENTTVANPAFDVTPARLVTGIITEAGIFSPSQLRPNA